MTIYRSRAVPTQAAGLIAAAAGSPSVLAAISDWQRKVAAARDEGRALGVKDAQVKIAAAEQRAAKAEAKADEKAKAEIARCEERLGKAIAALEAAASRLADLERQLVQNAEAEVVRLGLAVAARILRRELSEDAEWMTEILASALREVPDRRGVAVRLHPDDAVVAREHADRIAAGVPGLDRLSIQDDPALARGACLLMSQGTRIDAGVASSWERIAARLLAAAPIQPLAVASDGTIPALDAVMPPPDPQLS